MEELLAIARPLLILLDVLGNDAPHVPVKPHEGQVGRGHDVPAGRLDKGLDLG